MPALKNERHERFAQEIAKGADIAEAFRSSGCVSRGRDPEAAAMRLVNMAGVARRIAELSAAGSPPTPAQIEVTTATTLRELEEARKLAIAKKQPAPAISATMAKAKLAGLVFEKANDEPQTAPNFADSDIEAARRIAFLLGLAAIEPPGESRD
jgi:phage terminase small subunit